MNCSPGRSQITPLCDVCTCSMCAMSVPLDCIWRKAWNAAGSATRRKGRYSRAFSAHCLITAASDGEHIAECVSSNHGGLTGVGPRGALQTRSGRKTRRYDVSTGGRRAYTIWSRHHRKLPGLQDAGRTHFLRSSTSRVTDFRKHQICHRLSQRGGAVRRRARRRAASLSCARDG